MEAAEIRAALEEARKIFSLITDAAVLADLFHKDPVSGKAVPNAQHLPGYVKTREHVAKFNEVMQEVGKVDSHARMALVVHWIPKLHPIQNDDLVVSIAAAAQQNKDAARDTLLHIARMPDPDRTNPDQSRSAVMGRINEARSAEADSLNLIMRPETKYGQYHIDQIKGGLFGSGKAFAAFVQANWPAVQGVISDRIKQISATIGQRSTATTAATGLAAKAERFLERMKAFDAKHKR